MVIDLAVAYNIGNSINVYCFFFFLKNKQYMATQEKKVMIQITKGRIFLFFNDKFCLLIPVTGMLLVSHEFNTRALS